MAQANYTPIQLYRSTTASAVPTSGNLAAGELAINTNDGKLYYKDSGGTVQLIASKAGASGDVVGPASATDNAVVRFDGTTGKLVQNSVVTIADSTGDISGVGQLNATTVDTTNLEVTNIKAIDGTAAASIANSTGVVSITANPVLSGGTANGVLYLNGSKVATSGSALTFNGTTFTASGSSNPEIKVKSTAGTTGNYAGILFDSFNSFSGSGQAYVRGVSSNPANSNTDLSFGVNASGFGAPFEAMRLDAVGNLGLGVTPSAWDSASKAFQISSHAVFAAYTSGTNQQALLLNNAYLSATGYKYLNSNYATYYQQQASAGAGTHAWFTAPSGTAGNPISFTQAMTLTQGGNLLVGTTSSGYRLGVTTNSGAGIQVITAGATTGAPSQDWYDTTNLTEATLTTGNALISFGAYSNTPLALITNNTERARITSGGFVLVNGGGSALGIGDQYVSILGTSGSSPLLATSASGNNSAAALFLAASTTSYTSNIVDIRTGMASGTGFNAITYKSDTSTTRFVVAGNGDVTNTNGTYGTISDAKMKTDIVDAGSQWDDIKALRFRKFKMKDDPSQVVQLGVVAQEVEQVSPGLVEEHIDRDAEGNNLGTTTKSVKTSVLLMKAAVALQEAMARIETLEAKVAQLEGA